MTITIITGVPGSGKSAAAVDLIRIEAAKGRKVYADGVDDLVVEHELITDVRQWHKPGVVDDGSLIFIDEAQRHWRPAGAGSKVPDDIAEFETHRHRGLDFIIVTQHTGLLHANIRKLCARHIHIRDAGAWLGRWWYEWPSHANTDNFKSAPIKKKYSLPKSVFHLYKSATLHIKPVRSLPRSVMLLGVALILGGWLAWIAYGSISKRIAPPPAPGAVGGSPGVVVGSPPGRLGGAVGRFPAGQGRVVAVSSAVVNREPYAGLGVHLAGSYQVGQVSRAWFSLSLDGRVISTITDRHLIAAGYVVRTLAPCALVLVFGDQERAVTCDAPQAPPPSGPVSPGPGRPGPSPGPSLGPFGPDLPA